MKNIFLSIFRFHDNRVFCPKLWSMVVCVFNILIGCKTTTKEKGTEMEFTDSKDYFSIKAEIKYAKGFSVEYHDNYKVIRTKSELPSWSGNESVSKEDIAVLVQRGTQVPELTGELVGAEVIEIPAQRVAVNIEVAENYLAELGLSDRLVAIGGLISYDDGIRNQAVKGKLKQVGYSWHQPPMFENLLASKADLFLMTLSNLDFAESLNKCRELGVPTVPVFSWSEKDYMAQAEWIKYYSLFFNAEEMANIVFAQIERNIAELKQKVAQISEKPTIIWGYYAGKDTWVVHRNSKGCELLKDAGTTNILFQPKAPLKNGGESMAFEELLSKAKDVDHWIIGDVHSSELPRASLMESFKAWRSGNLYHNFKRSKPDVNAYDWYGSAIVRPDRVLADLIYLVHPEIIPNHNLYYMDGLSKDFKFPIEQEAL